MTDPAEEDALHKSGKDLFTELLRYYPVAEYDDYFRNGQWKDEQMRIDLQLYLAHRNEAGAPVPVSLEEVKLPDLPAVTAPPKVIGLGSKAIITPAISATSDLRELAQFVSKYKLEPVKVKTLVGSLLSARRKYVLTNFSTTSTGADAFLALEAFVKECERTKKWDTVSVGAAANSPSKTQQAVSAVPPASVAQRPAGGFVITPPAASVANGMVVSPPAAAKLQPASNKRPLATPPSADPSKRPRITPPVNAGAPSAGAAWGGCAWGGKGLGAMKMRPPAGSVVRPPSWKGW